MDRILSDFINISRRAGVRISTSESLDAFHALASVGYSDREFLKDTLSAVLAKTLPEKEILGRCFDMFFTIEGFPDSGRILRKTGDPEKIKDKDILTDMLLRQDQSSLDTAMRVAAREVNLESYMLPTQKGLLTNRILEQMGIASVQKNINALQDKGLPSGQGMATALESARDELAAYVRQFVSRRIDLQIGDPGVIPDINNLNHSNLSLFEQNQFQIMNEIIRHLIKKLNDNLSRRHKSSKRGHLDFKHTLRKNVTYQGLLFDPKWKDRKIDRPDVIVLCDVSRSVIRAVRFLLLILYSLNSTMVRIKSFVFCSTLMEVTDIFRKYPVADAISMIQNPREFPIIIGRTDYEKALSEFYENYFSDINRKTTIIILGDARNNFGNPRADLLKKFYERCRRLIWLNPEIRSFWGTGDSEMKRYIPYCHTVKECNTLSHLEKVVMTTILS